MPLVNFSGSSMEARYGGLPNGRPVKSYDACGPIRPWVLLKDVIEVIKIGLQTKTKKRHFFRQKSHFLPVFEHFSLNLATLLS